MGDGPDPMIGLLIVDDHRMFAESLARLLSDDTEIEVIGIAGSASEAIDLAGRLHPDVVLMDYHLPDRDGVAAMASIRSRNPEIMVVMLTGSSEDGVLIAAIDAGCSGFLTKDRAAAEVAEAVRAAAAGEAVISPALLSRLLPKMGRTPRSVGDDLSDREREILEFLARGWTNKVIAAELCLSVNTIRNHVQSVLAKLGSHSKLEAVSTAVREGIIDYHKSA
jgi:two-component system response regulator DevR